MRAKKAREKERGGIGGRVIFEIHLDHPFSKTKCFMTLKDKLIKMNAILRI